LAGSWRLAVRTDDGVEPRFIGINVAEAESNPAPIGSDGLSRAIDSTDIRVVQSAADWEDAIFARRRGRDLRTALITMVLLALALEALLAAPRRSRSSIVTEARG
jgi:hypothetical protein